VFVFSGGYAFLNTIKYTNNEQKMNKENPIKYSLQISTCEAIIKYAEKNNISFRQSCFIAFANLKKNKKVNCGFNLISPVQFYSSFRRFRSCKMSSIDTRPP
jgi:hypothetical protein